MDWKSSKLKQKEQSYLYLCTQHWKDSIKKYIVATDVIYIWNMEKKNFTAMITLHFHCFNCCGSSSATFSNRIQWKILSCILIKVSVTNDVNMNWRFISEWLGNWLTSREREEFYILKRTKNRCDEEQRLLKLCCSCSKGDCIEFPQVILLIYSHRPSIILGNKICIPNTEIGVSKWIDTIISPFIEFCSLLFLKAAIYSLEFSYPVAAITGWM